MHIQGIFMRRTYRMLQKYVLCFTSSGPCNFHGRVWLFDVPNFVYVLYITARACVEKISPGYTWSILIVFWYNLITGHDNNTVKFYLR